MVLRGYSIGQEGVMNERRYERTMYACFIGYIVQAIVNNFVTLLFLTFEKSYHIPLGKITMLITINFGIQLLVDLLSAGFVDKIGYKVSIILAHVFAAAGMFGLVFLPELLPDAFSGLLISVVFYAVGGGLIEVLISPIMESCPTKNKEKAMSLLHSFYCWGTVGVVLGSTIFFGVFGITSWKILACIWAIVPIANIVLFVCSPIAPLIEEGEKGMTILDLCKNKIFWGLMLLMVSATFTGMIITSFEDALSLLPVLTAFITMLMDTGGNAGSQASVTVIRGLSLNEIEYRDVPKVVFKEIRVALICGITLSAANFVKLLLLDKVGVLVAASVCLTLVAAVVIAMIIGCLLPILAKRLGFDPAVMASPFITTIVDAMSLLVYFRVASAILGL